MLARSGGTRWAALRERDGPTYAQTLSAHKIRVFEALDGRLWYRCALCAWHGRRQGKLLNHILSTQHTNMRRSYEVNPWDLPGEEQGYWEIAEPQLPEWTPEATGRCLNLSFQDGRRGPQCGD